jgi:hypothetical protein
MGPGPRVLARPSDGGVYNANTAENQKSMIVAFAEPSRYGAPP